MTLRDVLRQRLVSRELVNGWKGWEEHGSSLSKTLYADLWLLILGRVAKLSWLVFFFSAIFAAFYRLQERAGGSYATEHGRWAEISGWVCCSSLLMLMVVGVLAFWWGMFGSEKLTIVRDIQELKSALGLPFLAENDWANFGVVINNTMEDTAEKVMRTELIFGDKAVPMDDRCEAGVQRLKHKRALDALYAAGLKFSLIGDLGECWKRAKARFSRHDQDLLGDRG